MEPSAGGLVALILVFVTGETIDRNGYATVQQCNVAATLLHSSRRATSGYDALWVCIDDRGARYETRCRQGDGCLPSYLLDRR